MAREAEAPRPNSELRGVWRREELDEAAEAEDDVAAVPTDGKDADMCESTTQAGALESLLQTGTAAEASSHRQKPASNATEA